MVEYALEQRVFLYNIYAKYVSASECRRKFRREFRNKTFPIRQIIHNLVKLRTGLLMDKKQKNMSACSLRKINDIEA
jgi:hypothetical protein